MKSIVNIKMFVVGFVTGIANIIPGLSGGTVLALSGMYENIIERVNTATTLKFRSKQYWRDVLPLSLLLLAVVIAIFSLSHVLSPFLDKGWFYFIIFVFVTASTIIFGVKSEINVFKHRVGFVLGLVLPLVIAILGMSESALTAQNSLLMFFIAGILSAITLIIPGISGALLLTLIGAYDPFINALKNFEVLNIVAAAIGVVIGLIIAIKGLAKLFKENTVRVNTIILSVLISSCIVIFILIFKHQVYTMV